MRTGPATVAESFSRRYAYERQYRLAFAICRWFWTPIFVSLYRKSKCLGYLLAIQLKKRKKQQM